jgi:hypothetical protein
VFGHGPVLPQAADSPAPGLRSRARQAASGGGVSGRIYPGLVRAEAEERYEDLVGELLGIPGVSPPRGGGGFGRSSLRFQNKIFAMLVRGRLVVKLPAARVDALIAAGDGVRFDANKGTPMREWFSLDPESSLPWAPLAREALEFARSSRPGS